MSNTQNEQVESLKELINSYYKKRKIQRDNHNVQHEDLLWDASRFWVLVLYKTGGWSRFKTLAELEQFADQYNRTALTPVKISELFDRYWVREVAGYIHMPGAVRWACKKLGELRYFKNELQFVCEFYNARSERQQLKVPIAEVEEAKRKYASKNGVWLNGVGIYYPKWARITDELVEFSAMDIYIEPLLQSWSDFEFLYQWQKTVKDDEESRFTISKNEFLQLWESFDHFAARPTIDSWKEKKIIVEQNDTFYLEASNAYWYGLQDKIGGYFWELLISDNGFTNDGERVVFWLNKFLIGNRWPAHLDYVTAESRKRFLNASVELLLAQNDLNGCDTEFTKLRLDSYRDGAEAFYRGTAVMYQHHQLDSQNLFELYNSLIYLEEETQKNYLYDQPTRHWLHFLVTAIVLYDNEWGQRIAGDANSNQRIPRIRLLLRKGVEKPFLVWTVSEVIRYRKPDILPHLFTDADTCAYALCILDQLEFNADAQNANFDCWAKAVKLILASLPPLANHEDIYANVIYQVFCQLMESKYDIPYNHREKQERQRRQQQEKKQSVILDLLENAPVAAGPVYRGPVRYILPEIFEQVADKFVKYKKRSFYQRNVVQFPMLKWDAMFWLLKTTTQWKVRKYFSEDPMERNKLIDAFLLQYLEILEIQEVQTYDYWENKEKKSIPLWSEKIERLELLDWIYPVYFISERGLLPTFLTPRLHFEVTNEYYHKKNQVTAEKLRTHIGVLLQVLRKLVLPSLPYGFEKAKLQNIKEKIEWQVVQYLEHHAKDIPQQGKVDLFSYSKETLFKQSEKEALLPQIAQAINWFSKKDDVVKALVSSKDLVKLLTVLDYVTAEGIKKLLLEKVRATEITVFFEGLKGRSELQAVLVKLSYYPDLLPLIEQAVLFWKENVVSQVDIRGYKIQLYVSELLIAYFKGDINAINSVEEPGDYNGSRLELKYSDYKTFYIGLSHIKSDPEKAKVIFNGLAIRYPQYSFIALNRMVAKLNLGKMRSDHSIYRDAYDEWKESEKNYFKDYDLESMEPQLSANLMTILLALGEHQEIENIFNKIEFPLRMTEAVLTVRINSLVEQKRTAEALLLVDNAKTYHEFSGVAAIGFIKELEKLVSGEDDFDELAMYCGMIFNQPPEKLVQMLPGSLNGKKDFYEFLIKEIVNAAGKMLEKIRSIDEIKSEDKYNDLVEIVLDSRLNGIGLHVGAQNRGGYSDSPDTTETKQPGERDLPIMDRNKNVLLVCEALIYRGKTTAESHLQKMFDYTHQRNVFAILYYDTGETKKDFIANWKYYEEKILPVVKFPAGMEISSGFTEVSAEYGVERSAINVGKTIHGEGTVVYHIFVNINYKLN